MRAPIAAATILVAWWTLLTPSRAEAPFYGQGEFPAQDSLNIQADASADARECLAGLAWEPAAFTVQCTPAEGLKCDALVRFPSPVDSGDAVNDRVALEWYVARDAQQRPIRARAVVVVHESGSKMPVGRLFASELRRQGLHALMINLPHYGQRRGDRQPARGAMFTLMRQAIADVRRARDAVAVLPLVDATHIALQGTSLGGFVAATAASLDATYDGVYLMLAGGDLYDIIQHGEQDTANTRRELEQAGVTGEQLQALARRIEPLRVCHRLDPQRTWLYSGVYDRVVPLQNAVLLAKAARLTESHHVQMLADHYTGIVYLPSIITEIAARVRSAGLTPQTGTYGKGTAKPSAP
jgi:predicted alpha/beta-hydrolase family hydrolase